MPSQRRLKQIGIRLDRPCGLCSGNVAVVAEARSVRRGLAWVNPLWDAEVERFEICSSCGARSLIDERQPAA